MSILRAAVNIVGKRPLLFHKFSLDSLPLQKKEKTGVAGNDPEEWKRSVLATKEGQLYLESTYIFGCLRDGGKHIRAGKGTIQPKIASTLTVIDEVILMDRFLPPENQLSQDPTQLVYLDVRAVKNPSTKGRNIRYRIAASSGWKLIFQIEWEGTVVSRSEMEAALLSAGSLVGLGDGRTIGFGRFEVSSFKIEESAEKPKGKKKT